MCIIMAFVVDTGYIMHNLIYINTFNAQYFSVLYCCFQNMSFFKIVVFVVYGSVSYTCIVRCLHYTCNVLRGVS